MTKRLCAQNTERFGKKIQVQVLIGLAETKFQTWEPVIGPAQLVIKIAYMLHGKDMAAMKVFGLVHLMAFFGLLNRRFPTWAPALALT